MSDKLAPLLERQGPWLLTVHSTMEDTDVWAAYVKLSEESRNQLRRWKKTVERLKQESELFYSLQIWSPIDVRFIEQSPHTKADLGEVVEELMDGNVDQLLVMEPFIEVIESLETRRTECDLAVITVDGVTWEACCKYSRTQYSTAMLLWEDI